MSLHTEDDAAMDRYSSLASGGGTHNDEQQPPKQLRESSSSMASEEAKLRAAQASQQALLDDVSKGSGSDQDDASSEMHGDEYGEEDSAAGGDSSGVHHQPAMAGDRLAVLKRQKRLAMNRESARNRRKRKKVLLETLQKQNDQLTKANHTLVLSKAALTTKVQALEHELSILRTTMAHYQLGGGSSNNIGNRIGGMAHGGGVGGLGGSSLQTGSHNLHRGDAMEQQLRSQASDSMGGSDNISRLMQAQLDHLALQQQQPSSALDTSGTGAFHQQSGLGAVDMGASSFPFRSSLPQSSFTNEGLLRRHGLDLQALSQASRDSALGSLMSRQHQNDALGQQDRETSERSLASSGLSQSAGMRADFDQQFLSQQLNPLLMDQRGGFHGSALSGQAHTGMRLPDAWLHQSDTSQDDIAANSQQQILHELLRQRHSGGNWDSKLPPNKQSDSSM